MVAGVGEAAEPSFRVAVLIAVILFVLVILALIVITVIAKWKIFQKEGIPGWAALVPYYDTVRILEMNKQPLWWSFMMLIPIVNIFFGVKMFRRWAAVFGKGAWFTVGMIFLPFIFWPILGFGKAEYNAKAFPEPKPLTEAGKHGLITAAIGTAFMFLWMIPSQIEPMPLSIISESYGYATDGNYVYHYDKVIRGADAESFELTGDYYAKDWLHVYYDGKKISGADPYTFEELTDTYAKDESHVYYDGTIVEDADPMTFEMVEGYYGGYQKDANGIYYYGKKLPGADITTFELLRYEYQKDATHVYHAGDLIPDADAASFKTLNEPTEVADAYDKNYDYNYGEVVELGE